MDDDLKRLLVAMQRENAAAHEETRRHTDTVGAELRSHFDVTAERLDHKIELVAEGVTTVNEKLDREIHAIRQELKSGFAETQAMIKFSHADLDRRMRALEDVVSD